MKDGQKILFFDIDGTAIRWSLPAGIYEFLLRHRSWLISFGILLPPLACLACAFYVFRPCNKRARAIIRDHIREGGQAISVSSTKDARLTRWMARACLKSSRIPFHGLFLCPGDEATQGFKLRMIREEGCDVFLENERDIALYARDKLQRDGFRDTSISSNHGFFVVRFGDFRPIKTEEVVA